VPEISLPPNRPWPRLQDFERYYDAGLGIRHQPKGDGDDDDEEEAPLGSGSADGAPANGGADLAVFEQYERLVIIISIRPSPECFHATALAMT
jgi:hypothetical protein